VDAERKKEAVGSLKGKIILSERRLSETGLSTLSSASVGLRICKSEKPLSSKLVGNRTIVVSDSKVAPQTLINDHRNKRRSCSALVDRQSPARAVPSIALIKLLPTALALVKRRITKLLQVDHQKYRSIPAHRSISKFIRNNLSKEIS